MSETKKLKQKKSRSEKGNFEVYAKLSETKEFKAKSEEYRFRSLSAFVKACIKFFIDKASDIGEVLSTKNTLKQKRQQDLASAVNKIGNNVNQIARAINTANLKGEEVGVYKVLEELCNIQLSLASILEDENEH